MTATTSTITPATHAATAAVSASVSVISTPLSINNNHDNGGDGSHNIDVGSWVNAGYEFIDYTRCVDGEASSSEEDGLSMEVERIDSTSNSSEGDEIFWARGASVDMDGGLV